MSNIPQDIQGILPLPCPFCGSTPVLTPENPKIDGDTWGAVSCDNKACPAQPYVHDGESIADNRGLVAYQQAAIRRWNIRHRV